MPCNPRSPKDLARNQVQGFGETGRALMTEPADKPLRGPQPEAGINFSRDRLEIADRGTNWNDDATGRVPVRRVY